MRALFSVLLLALTGCSVLFDGSGYVARDGAVDAAVDAGTDAPMHVCTPACGAGTFCAASGCLPCDGDHDGFVADPSCAMGTPYVDCDDGNAAIHPGAAPTCGNGIDESCGAMGPVGFPSDEIGFYATQEVALATGTVPSHLRVFGRTATGAIVLFDEDATTARTVWVGDVPLVDTPQTSTAMRWLDYIGDAPAAGEHYRYDALRDVAGQIHVALLREVSATELHLLDATVPTTGMPHGVDTHGPIDPSTLGLAMYTTAGDPALVRAGTNLYLGQPSRASESGGAIAPLVVTIGVDNMQFDITGHGGDTTSPWSGVSSGTAAAFPAPSGELLLWNGSLDTTATDELAHLAAGVVGRPALAQLMPPSGAEFLTAIVAPVSDGFDLFTMPCASSAPWSACPPSAAADGHLAIPVPTDPHLSAFSVGPSQLAIMFAPPMTMMGSDLLFAFVDTHDTSAGLAPFTMPAPGVAQISDTAMDAVLVARGTGAHPMALEVTLVYAYVRHIPAMPAALYVGGVHVCTGFGGL